MIYKGFFRQVGTDALFEVSVTTTSAGASKEVSLGGTPFVSEIVGDGKNIYKPVKYSGATIEMRLPGYVQDLYSAKAHGTKVELKKGDKIIWTGYATPNLYNQGYVKCIETTSIECIDGLATLQYYKYQRSEKQIITFIELINRSLRICGCYTDFYVSANVQLPIHPDKPVLERLLISESNFFDKKREDEADADVAWTYRDVLEEICQYLGLTAVAVGTSVYFIDYDALKAHDFSYYHYNIGDEIGVEATIGGSRVITGRDYSETGATISMSDVYNKITVSDDFATFDTVIPSIYAEGLINITEATDPKLSDHTKFPYAEILQNERDNGDSKETMNMEVVADLFKTTGNVAFIKYFNSKNYSLFNCPESLNYSKTRGFRGAFIAKMDTAKIGNMIYNLISNNPKTPPLDSLLSYAGKSDISMINCLVLMNPNDGQHISNDEFVQYVKSKRRNLSAFFGGKNAYLLISGSLFWHIFPDHPYLIDADEFDLSEGRYAIDADHAYIEMTLNWGNLFWDGKEWKDGPTTFKVPYFSEADSDKDRRADACICKDIKLKNTVSWRIGTNEKGYLIPMPEGKIVYGYPEFSILKPHDPNFHSAKSGKNAGYHYKMEVQILKNFNIKAIIADPTFSDAQNSDTKYTNVIDYKNICEFDELKFKICTNDGKNPNYSSVAYSDGNDYYFVDKMINRALASEQTKVTAADGTTGEKGMRQEEQMVYKLTKQYSTPNVILNLTLRDDISPIMLYSENSTDMKGRAFIVNAIKYDYRMKKSYVQLVEKF